MKTLAMLFVAFMAGVGVTVVGMKYYESANSSESKKSNVVYDIIKKEALLKFPAQSEAQAINSVATEAIKNVVDGEKDEKRKLRFLTEAFFGYYMINTRTRADFCKGQGVDITPFVKAFEERNKIEYSRGLLLAKQTSLDPEAMYEQIASDQMKIIDTDMNDLAQRIKGTTKDGCLKVLSMSDHFANYLYIGTRQPDLYKALFGSPKKN